MPDQVLHRRIRQLAAVAALDIVAAAALAAATALAVAAMIAPAAASYTNFESSHVHPLALTPSGHRLLAVNTPDALLEVLAVGPGGALTPLFSVPVGLEPVTVRALSDNEVWVVNHLSDSISIVDLAARATVRTLPVGDEPTDVVFANGKAFVAVSQEDAVKVFDLARLDLAPAVVAIFSSDPRALAVSRDGTRVYVIALNSGNQTTVVNANVVAGNASGLDPDRLTALGLNDMTCRSAPPAYPPLPDGIERNPALVDPAPPAPPPVSLIVQWDEATSSWRDEAGQSWSDCLPFRLPDHDLFAIATSEAPVVLERVDHLGTTLFEVSVNPASGKIYVPNTEARNMVRFEHPLGVTGHMVDNRLSIVDPAAGNRVTVVDLNTHIDRRSDPASNLLERLASVSQPGMLVWNAAGTAGYLTAIGSRKVFRVDPGCAAGACIFGPSRALPAAIEVGEGPSGAALHEPSGTLYVLNRFSNSIALVDTVAWRKIGEAPLHDASPPTVRSGRRLLYDGIDSSGHGDAACSSCHISGNLDELAWDLGDPTGSLARYGTPGDNVRFIIPLFNQPVPCDPAVCAAHLGFDPQKGPMTTQTLRGMLEPLHWRGDRGTMNAFNKAFVGLMGRQDIGPINGEPAGLPAADMELFRQFALGITFPPNPYRNADDTLPNAAVSIPGVPFAGNPAAGGTLFTSGRTDAAQSCASCHALPFGAAGGKLGGVNPGDPATARAALFNGNADGSPHSDLKVPHTRNMHEKFGPRFGSFTNAADPPADQKTGFGYTHDGSVPDLGTFLSASVFTLTAQQVRDITMFMVHFPGGVRPAVGRSVTVPAGAAPTGTPAQESLLGQLVVLGNLADAARHCELTASARASGRTRAWRLEGGIGSGGLWTTDVAGELQVTTAAMRQGAAGPVTFLCAPLGSGPRLGGDRDEDGRLDGADCNAGDPLDAQAAEVAGVTVGPAAATVVRWEAQAQAATSFTYDVAGGALSALRSSGVAGATSCLSGGLALPAWDDGRADPPRGDGWFYLVRGRNSCGAGTFGAPPADPLVCPAP